jgi:aldo/keto reductase family protein
VVSTKVGRVLQPGRPSRHFVGARPFAPVFDYSRDGVRRSLAESLERLQLGRVDIAFLHDPDRHIDEARRSIDAVRELAAHVGVGTNDVETALAFVEAGEVDVVLIAGRYTLLDRSAERELLPVSAERGLPVIAAGVQQRRACRRSDVRLRVCASGNSEAPRRTRSGMCSPCGVARRRGNPVPAQTSGGRIDSRRRPVISISCFRLRRRRPPASSHLAHIPHGNCRLKPAQGADSRKVFPERMTGGRP